MVLGNTEDGGPFIYDLLKRTETLTNSNYFTGGVAGMGKSFLNKKIIKFLRMFGVKIYIFDPEGEYGDLVHQMGGTVINRASGKWKNNIFQVRRFKSADEDDRIGLEYGGETPVYYQHLSWLQEQLSIIHSGLSADNLRALMVMVQDKMCIRDSCSVPGQIFCRKNLCTSEVRTNARAKFCHWQPPMRTIIFPK